MSGLEYAPEGILLPSVDRSDGTYNNTEPPIPAPENTPPDDPPTPSLPYNATTLPSDLAMPFNASDYFASYAAASVSGLPSLTGTSVSSSSAKTPAISACVGNQVEGSCTMASVPSTRPDSGPQELICNKVDSPQNIYLMFNETQAAHGAAAYCAELISAGVVLSATTTAPKAWVIQNAAENGGYISLTVLFDVDSCDPGTLSSNQKLDLKHLGQDQCYQYLFEAIARPCEFEL